MIYIRVDMNPVIATGHLMRCLSVAEAVVALGEEVTIISADEYPSAMVAEKGYGHIVLGTDWQDMDSELATMEKIIKENGVEVILVDTYQVTENYLKELNRLTKVFYIDDLNQIKHYVTGLINYACYADDMVYNVETEYFKGCKYAPLRKMFSDCSIRKTTSVPKKILVMSGGTDPCDMLVRTLTVIRDYLPKRYEQITLICGRYYSDVEGLKKKVAEGGSDFADRVRILNAVDNMRAYLEETDVVISAGGTTMYEVCAVGVPTISFAIVDNQLQNVEWLDKHDIVPCAGDARKEGTEKNIIELLKKFDNVDTVNGYSERMQALVDGKGAERVAALLIEHAERE